MTSRGATFGVPHRVVIGKIPGPLCQYTIDRVFSEFYGTEGVFISDHIIEERVVNNA